ncbi:hypothetical protein ACO3VM_09440 (plasmid) [Methanocaldococcus sp. 10A]
MISLKIIDENKEVLFSVNVSSEKLQSYSMIATAITDALPHIADSIAQNVPIIGNMKKDVNAGIMEIIPVVIALFNKGAKGSCVFQVSRKVWESEIRPQIEPLLK